VFVYNGRSYRMSWTRPESEREAEEVQVTKKKLMEDLKTVVVDAEELLKKAASDQTREWISTAQAKAKKSLKAANDWLAEEEGAMTSKARATARATEDYVRANTWMVLGMTAMAGLFVGILAVRFGRSFIEEGKRLVTKGTKGGRAIQDGGKRLKETGEER
jgi:ElaB/YqjD/DUF883 family membrane-anchored ribosome-binding protein